MQNSLWTFSVEADEAGAFFLEGLIPGSYSLAIVAQLDFDSDMEDLRIEVDEGDHLTDIKVPYSGEGLVIAGRVPTRTASHSKALSSKPPARQAVGIRAIVTQTKKETIASSNSMKANFHSPPTAKVTSTHAPAPFPVPKT